MYVIWKCRQPKLWTINGGNPADLHVVKTILKQFLVLCILCKILLSLQERTTGGSLAFFYNVVRGRVFKRRVSLAAAPKTIFEENIAQSCVWFKMSAVKCISDNTFWPCAKFNHRSHTVRWLTTKWNDSIHPVKLFCFFSFPSFDAGCAQPFWVTQPHFKWLSFNLYHTFPLLLLFCKSYTFRCWSFCWNTWASIICCRNKVQCAKEDGYEMLL